MRDELFESFPFGIIRIDSDNKIQRMNYYAKQLTHALDHESLEMLLSLKPKNDITSWSVANHQVALSVELFMVRGDSHRLLLLGLEPNFTSTLPPQFERALEDLTTDPEEIVLRIVNMISAATSFERFDLVRVNPHLRKYSYAYSIGLGIEGTLYAPYSQIRKTGLGWILETEAPQLSSSLQPESFSFSEDPLLYQTGFRSAMRVPILFGQEVIGAILLGGTRSLQFEIEDAYLINQISRHFSQAFYHSGIIEERSYHAIATSAFLHSIAGNLKDEHILDFLNDYCTQLQLATQLESIHLCLLDQEHQNQKLLVSAGKKFLQENEWKPLNKEIAEMLQVKSIVCYSLAHTQTQNTDELLNQGFTSILYAPIEHRENIVAALVAAAMDEKASSPHMSGLFKVATEQLSSIVAHLQGVPNAVPEPKPFLQSFKKTRKDPLQDQGTSGFSRIIGSSKIMQDTIQNAARAAQYDFPILITGETGTGKELLAKAIHQSSQVAQGPFIVVNSAAIPANLLESELFGYQEGAFSGGAKGGKPGKILLANRGTLFLDEIGELSPELQAKLLRVIQEQEVEPLGAIKPIPVKVRILSATHRDLSQMVEQGEFREDLFYRLNSIEVKIPPLRDRGQDILELAEHMLQFLAQSHGTPEKTLSPSAQGLLLKYTWPGNIRQLQNIINRLYVFVEDSVIHSKDLPPDLRVVETDKGNSEKEEIESLLAEFGGNKTALAQYLGITRTGLWKKLKRLGLQ
ncbi:sigma-54-dependent Fis family transcriptional regulator [Desulfitobacterium sp. PCE1]|uniref:sigma-54-dependent Fis family transcriptional regulator n=1 Tax=Desulfitobacterium sp. PCE1 TaxID=146907 RepID=UPI00037B0F28|nr:sigma-54-dependent Fis family transcriptional regulator [Desulfitobacterium sp. PCE1]